jgi:FixJ family two-component response regulator
MMLDVTSTIFVIDDDDDIRHSLGCLLVSAGLNAKLFASVSDFLKSEPTEGPSCLILDVRLPGKSGLAFQRELAEVGKELPIIFITGHGDIPMSVQAIKNGAIEFFTKPVRDKELLDAIQAGLACDRVRRENESALIDLRKRFASLSPRERQVVVQVANGRLNKQIANDIGIAQGTVKVHRSKAMQKMNARSLLEFGQMVRKLNLTPEQSKDS